MKEDLDEFNLSDRMKDFENNPQRGDKIKKETTTQVKQYAPSNDIEDWKQKVTEWLKTVRPKRKETGERKENDSAKHLPSKERIMDFLQSVLSKSVLGQFFSLLFFVFSLICFGVLFFFWLRYFVNYTPLLCVVCKFRYSLLPRPYFIASFYGAISVRSFRRSRFFPRWP